VELQAIPNVADLPELPPLLSQAIQEILKVIFNITIEKGPLAHGAPAPISEDEYRRDFLHQHLVFVRLLFAGLSSREKRTEIFSQGALYYTVRLRVMNWFVFFHFRRLLPTRIASKRVCSPSLAW
jgi:hypothetical protein